jgi:fructokinase
MRIGIDFGGTKIEAVMLDSGGRLMTRKRVPNPGSYEASLNALVDLVQQIEIETNVKAAVVGVGMPGSLSPATGMVRNSNSVWLNGKPFFEDLKRVFARPVRVANDANCFALSEATDGAGAGAPVVFGVILGTGCGGGVVVNGRVIEGVNGIGGEWGHTPLPWPSMDELQSPHCWCGRPLCLETWISGSGLARWGSDAMGRKMRAEEIVAASRAGDEKARACMDTLCDRIARGLSVVMDIIDPDAIVLGGGLSNVDEIYDGIRARWSKYVFSDVIRTKLIKNMHGDSSGVRGAAWLFTAEEAK